MSDRPAPPGWHWRSLTEIARLESGHTPSRRHPEYWDGDIPWIGIRDAKRNHGHTITDTEQHVNQLGIDNSSARVLPAGTVCLSRTASVGYVLEMGRPMATSQDFANWVCSDELCPRFLAYLFLAEERSFSRFSSGAIHQTMYYPELKAFHVCIPDVPEQRRIVAILDQAIAGIDQAIENTEKTRSSSSDLYDTLFNALLSERDPDWMEAPLGDLAELKNGLNFTKNSVGETVKIVGVKDFRSNFSVPIDDLDSVQIDGNLAPSYELKPNDIVTVRSNGNKQLIGRCILTGNVTEKTSHSGFTIRIRLITDDVESTYLTHYLKSDFARQRLIESGGGANISSLNQRALASLPVFYPDRPAQADIVEKLSRLEEQTTRLSQIYSRKHAALIELRRSLLQRAFSGGLTPSVVPTIRKEAVA